MLDSAAPAPIPVLAGSTRLAGIAGWPVTHSRSPRLHGFWLNRHGIDGAYVPLPIRPDDFTTAIHGLRAAGFRGVNVTQPHKLSAFAVCDVVDDTARRAGAVNTIVFAEDGIRGSNTDGSGFVANLRASDVEPAGAPVLLLGAGGGARAVAATLLDAGARVTIANRSPEPAAALARDLPGLAVIAWEARDAALADHALLVNATSLGMNGKPPLPLDLDRAAPGLAVADIVYVPLETPLLAAARARGMRTVDGLGMLLHQAGVGFAAWFGVTPVVDDELRRFVAGDLMTENSACPMKVIGLTGGIGMGKSTAAQAFRRARLPVFDADAAVHRLQARGGRAVRAIGAAFPGSVVDAAVDRTRLRAAVLGKPEALKQLEAILHPMVRQEERMFIARARRAGAPAVVLDIPLLLETGGHRRVDTVIVVSAPRAVQLHRVRQRRRMSPADLDAVLARQMPDRDKQRYANLVVRTGLSRHHALRTLRRLIQGLRP